MFSLCSLFALSFGLSSFTAATLIPQNVPPKVSDITQLGKTTSPGFKANIYRDGGSSGYANGLHMMIFADTMTSLGPPTNTTVLGAHNSFAYFGLDDPANPTLMHDFGWELPDVVTQILPAPVPCKPFSNESDVYGIWPSSNVATLSDGVSAVGMFPLVHFKNSSAVYNTMVVVNFTHPNLLGDSHPPTTRLVDRFFYQDEPLFGGLSVVAGVDGYLYMFASVSNGVKLARVREDQMTDRSKFEYFTGQAFGPHMPAKDDPSANVIQFTTQDFTGKPVGPDTGDCFYSNLHGTFLCVFMDATMSGQFWISYSTNGMLSGPWTAPVKLFAPDPNPTWGDECKKYGMSGTWNYAGHAHPHWDSTGKTLLLSWSSCTVFVNMAKLTFDGSDIPMDGVVNAADPAPALSSVVESAASNDTADAPGKPTKILPRASRSSRWHSHLHGHRRRSSHD